MNQPNDHEALARANRRLKRLGVIALLAPLFALLAAALWYAAQTWLAVEGPPMPLHGYIAMTLGVVFSLLVGCGLMALLFYSSRHGYDEPGSGRQTRSDTEPR